MFDGGNLVYPLRGLPGKIDHPVVFLRLERHQIQVEFIRDPVDVLVGQRMLPPRVAKHGRKVLGDVFARPKKRCKAVLASRKGNYDFHFIVR